MDTLTRRLRAIAGPARLYIVGGWLRDTLLGRASRDIDIAVDRDPEKIARKAARAVKGSFVVLDPVNKIYRIVLKDHPDIDYLDLSLMKGPDIARDLRKRDFTVNSMAVEITTEGTDLSAIIDPLKGRADLKRGIVRSSSARAFSDDPLRLLRAFRLASQLGFRVDPATRSAIRRQAGLIRKSAAERVREELFKILSAGCASVWVRDLERSGLLERIIPEIAVMRRSAREFYFHPQGLWQHAVETMISFESICSRLDRYFPQYHEKIAAHLAEPLSFGVTRGSILKLVALLHDAAKPATAQSVGKKMRFLDHEKRGAEIAAEVLARLRMSRQEIAITKKLIANHMRPVNLGHGGTLSARAAFRLFRDIGEELPDLLLLALSDWHSYKRLGTHRPSLLKKQETVLRELIRRYYGEKEKPARPRLLDGHQLMKIFKLEPGPIVGALLERVREAQELGKIATRDEAVALVKKELTRFKKRYKIRT